MFETAILRKHGQAFTGVDPGLIAETLLFYSNVHIVAHFGVLVELLRTLGADTLLRLLDDRIVTFTYLRSDFGVATVDQSGLEFHGFVSMRLEGHQSGKRKLTSEESVQLAFERALGRSWPKRRLARRFIDKFAFRQNVDVPDSPDGVPGLAFADLCDAAYVQDAVKAALVSLVPSYVAPADFRFEIVRGKTDFLIDHNINLTALNAGFRQLNPASDVTITPALISGYLLEARVDLQLASGYMAEIVTNSATASVVRRKLAAIMEKRDRNISEIEIFQEVQLRNARAIREAVNSGEHSFEDFLALLEKAEKFKGWLRSRNPDANLLDEYYKSVKAESWIEKLPSKGIRFLLTAGLAGVLETLFPSGIGVASGIGLGAADALLLDRLLRGWRPNQFIEGPLQRFAGQ